MYKIDFSDFYLTCGDLMRTHMEKIIDDERLQYINYAESHVNGYSNVKLMAKLLLEWSDNEFERCYTATHIKFKDAVDEIKRSKDKRMLISIHNALLSNVDIIKKCLSISVIPINVIVYLISHREILSYINFDDASCKLIYNSVHNKCDLLMVAFYSDNYDSMLYILNNMTVMELGTAYGDARFDFRSLKILIIDQIYARNDNYFKINLHRQFIMHEKDIIVKCYYIIKYMSREDGILLVELENRGRNANGISSDTLYNTLLEFHFRDRGSHTKSAITF
jgi:hypothetical protein